jgi:hypothetical protein
MGLTTTGKIGLHCDAVPQSQFKDMCLPLLDLIADGSEQLTCFYFSSLHATGVVLSSDTRGFNSPRSISIILSDFHLI